MRFVILPELLDQIEKNGYKGFKIVQKRGKSISLCNEKYNICVNIGSARTFGLGSKGFCLNTTRYNYPYMPSTAECFDSREEALSYAVVLIDAIEKTGSRYNPDDVEADIMRELMKEGDAYVCRSDETIPLDLAIAKEFGMNEKKREQVCASLQRSLLG